MSRTYTRKEYLALVEEIRRRHPGIALTTDIICGFCSETEEEYLDTYRVVQEVGYHAAFVFKYSERKNTIAARKYPDDVPDSVKAERVGRLVDMQKRISLAKNQTFIGCSMEVLVEGNAKKSADQWMGRTDSNLTVVWEKGETPLRPGDLISIVVTRVSATTLFGTSPQIA
jgi:tRNA-2-methylthio-N6-dimethylallyladenosine synthase